MQNRIKVLVTGGAGYLGSILVPQLLQRGYQVTIYDKFVYGVQSILSFVEDPKLTVIEGDILNTRALNQAISGQDFVVHLAAIVGFPSCNKDPVLARVINVDGTRNVAAALRKGQKLLFASTGSIYGKVEGICTEDTPAKPLSLYGETKWTGEGAIRTIGCDHVIFRFATVFGAAPRFRLDLLINDFVYQAIHNRQLAVFEGNSRRTFLHIYDAAMAFVFAIEHFDKMCNRVYNVGDAEMNYTKIEVARKIKEHVDFYLHEACFGTDPDQRDYEVDYSKLRCLGYGVKIRLDAGIQGLIKAITPIRQHKYL